MSNSSLHMIEGGAKQKQRRYYRVERRFSGQRPPKDLVRDLLRAHCGG